MAERAAQSEGNKISFISSTSEAAKPMTAGQKIMSVATSTVFVAIRVRGIAYDSNGRGWLPV